MKRKLHTLLVLFFACSLQAQTKMRPEEILHQAEMKRMPWQQMSLNAMLTDSSTGGVSMSSFKVFFNDDKALVVCIDPGSQKGNLLLLQKHDLWMYIHSTSQPMKMTALQRLSGSISFVDIARLNWATDFSVDSFETVRSGSNAKQEFYLLHLQSISPEVSYKKINLWVEKSSKKPLKAEIYLSQGKLYKTLLFTKYETIFGREMNTEIEFIDHFNKERKSVIRFSTIQPEKNLPENYFVKDKLSEVSKTFIGR